MSDRDPRMLPGPSARTLHTAAITLQISSFAVQGAAALGTIALRIFSAPARELPWTGALPAIAFGFVVVYFAVLGGFFATSSRAIHVQNAEVAAGYTTLVKEFDQVDCIDPKTGLVIRPARRRAGSIPRGAAITTGAELGPIDGLLTPFQLALRIRPLILALSAGIVVAGGVGILLSDLFVREPGDAWAVIALVVGIPALASIILIPIFIVGLVAPRRYTAVLASHFPAARVLAGSLTDANQATELLDSGAPVLAGAEYGAVDYFVFDAGHLTIYSRHRSTLLPFLAIPRGQVTGAQVAYPARSGVAPRLIVRKNNGSVVALTLLLGGLPGVSPAKELKSTCDWVLAWATAKP